MPILNWANYDALFLAEPPLPPNDTFSFPSVILHSVLASSARLTVRRIHGKSQSGRHQTYDSLVKADIPSSFP